MRIVTYNVNGIRAALKKGLAEWAADTDIDVLCLQETKAEAEQVDMGEFEAAGFVHQAWHSCRRKRGYSGVLTLSKVAPDLVSNDIGMEHYDCEGRIVRTDFGELTILNCYFPNGGQGEERQNFKYGFLDDFLEHVQELRKTRPNMLVVGDYNIAHTAIDLHAPKRNEQTTGFLPGERAWMTKWFSETGFVDAFRHLHPETNRRLQLVELPRQRPEQQQGLAHRLPQPERALGGPHRLGGAPAGRATFGSLRDRAGVGGCLATHTRFPHAAAAA